MLREALLAGVVLTFVQDPPFCMVSQPFYSRYTILAPLVPSKEIKCLILVEISWNGSLFSSSHDCIAGSALTINGEIMVCVYGYLQLVCGTCLVECLSTFPQIFL